MRNGSGVFLLLKLGSLEPKSFDFPLISLDLQFYLANRIIAQYILFPYPLGKCFIFETILAMRKFCHDVVGL